MAKNMLLLNYYKKEELKKIKTRWQEGKTRAEILRAINKNYITEKEAIEVIEQLIEENEDELENLELTEDEVIVDDFEEVNNITTKSNNTIVMIADSSLEDYKDQPFKLYDAEKRKEMVDSIRNNGIMQPLIVRPIENEKYQILAGHNRRVCGREVGLKEFPCIIKEGLSDDEALLYLVDTNLCTRDKISTMEKARAYKIKYETYKRINDKKLVIEEVQKDNTNTRYGFIKEEKSSNGTIQRYLRLTHLVPKLQDMVDENKFNINIGEKLSFIPNEEQNIIAEILKREKIKIKFSNDIIKRIKNASKECRKEGEYNHLTYNDILDIIIQQQDESKNKIKNVERVEEGIIIIFTKDEVKRFFGENETATTIKNYILNLLE